MSVSIEEVINSGGYDPLNDVGDAKWLLSNQSDFEDLCEKAEELVDKYEEYEDYVLMQEDEFGNFDNPTFKEWLEEK